MSTILLPISADLSPLHARQTLFGLEVSVPSRSIPGAVYRVTVDAERRLACNCPGFAHRGTCHHVRALLFLVHKRARPHGAQDTQVQSYHAFSEEDLGDRQHSVLQWLEQNGPASNREIAEGLKWPVNAVTGRVFELRDMELVADAGTKVDGITGRRVHVWRTVPKP
jgi:DNA-binding MarR family transcriptional regulator